MARLQPKRKLRTARGAEEDPEHLCKVCFRSFSSAQALGGHKNAHRKARAEARNGSAQGTRWVLPSPSAPLMHGCVYVVGSPQFLYVPPPASFSLPPLASLTAMTGSQPPESSQAGEWSVVAPGLSPLLVPSSSPSCRALVEEECNVGGVPHGCNGAERGAETPLGEIDLTLHL